ncbi:MAG TPA: alginate lyase family protein [Candidatus Marinimicrobia bacterium]|nr:alginate lyase family protein [Candidatus Neomarinimicrobiota bacterium]
MKNRLFLFLFFSSIIIFSCGQNQASEHPSLVISAEEGREIHATLGKYPILDKSYKKIVDEVTVALAKPVDVPRPGEAGGYEHERHKQNYQEMKSAGILFTITGDEKYARFIKNILDKYAELYPTLGPHPLSHDQKPGKLFHQMLNETVWLLNTAIAYDCIYNWLNNEDRQKYEENIFTPMVKWFTTEHPAEFNRIHNHGMWAAASVGMIGYVIKNQDYIDMALYGTNKDGTGGFLKQIEMLYSPDGYYLEGPYYSRYAMEPLVYFSEAIERNQPKLKIFEYKDKIIKKAYYAAVQSTFPNGVFFPINDASRTMNILAPGIIYGNSLVFFRYGTDINLLGIAKIQQEVPLNALGLKLAQEYKSLKEVPDFSWKSCEFLDGFDGKQGGLGILRHGEGADQTVLIMKYGVHGFGHGHFDMLHFMFYNQQREVIFDYGYARWINIEPKFGGRYLPENKSYAMQTIAHNTVVVDETTQLKFNQKQADQMHGNRHFFDAENENIQVMSAKANDYYPGIKMQRTMFLIKDVHLEYPVVVDIYRLSSSQTHQYDYPIHYHGQLINTNFKYTASTKVQKAMGDNYGYQHIWSEAYAVVNQCPSITWLDGNRYYTQLTSYLPKTEVYFGRIGAEDPDFNLISEPMTIIRQSGKDHLFASIIEPHGYFDESREISYQARPIFKQIRVVGFNDKGSVIEVLGEGDIHWRLMVNNLDASDKKEHILEFNGETYRWVGNYRVDLDVK